MNRVTSTALPTVAHQNGFNSTIFKRRANLNLVCIKYLCRSQFFSGLCAFFEHSEDLGSRTVKKTLAGLLKLSCCTTLPKEIVISFTAVDLIGDF
jgi:hypothetical protein